MGDNHPQSIVQHLGMLQACPRPAAAATIAVVAIVAVVVVLVTTTETDATIMVMKAPVTQEEMDAMNRDVAETQAEEARIAQAIKNKARKVQFEHDKMDRIKIIRDMVMAHPTLSNQNARPIAPTMKPKKMKGKPNKVKNSPRERAPVMVRATPSGGAQHGSIGSKPKNFNGVTVETTETHAPEAHTGISSHEFNTLALQAAHLIKDVPSKRKGHIPVPLRTLIGKADNKETFKKKATKSEDLIKTEEAWA